jgi:hypothetical protein
MLFNRTVRRTLSLALMVLPGLTLAWSATLERLSLDDMIAQSTAIVRGKVAGSYAAPRGPIIYTFYTLQVSEQLKGAPQTSWLVAVPGGTANHLRQTFPGAPEFKTGDEFVFFLWTGRSGITQIIGLTQGLFKLSPGAAGDPVATRAASSEVMLDHGTGRPVRDQTLVMNLSDLRSQILSRLGQGAVR